MAAKHPASQGPGLLAEVGPGGEMGGELVAHLVAVAVWPNLEVIAER